MLLRQLFDRDTSTYTYLLADEPTREALIIDPVHEQVERDLGLLAELGLSLRYVLETHVHADHVTSADELRARTGAQTVAGTAGAPCVDRHVAHGEVLRVGNVSVTALETPGHTDDSMSFLVASGMRALGGQERGAVSRNFVFTGDALLIRGTGRTDFQNGNAGQLYDSIANILFMLPDDTLVFPGHDYRGFTVSTIGEERRFNPRLAAKNREEFIEIMKALQLAPPAKIAVAVPANRECGRATTASA